MLAKVAAVGELPGEALEGVLGPVEVLKLRREIESRQHHAVAPHVVLGALVVVGAENPLAALGDGLPQVAAELADLGARALAEWIRA